MAKRKYESDVEWLEAIREKNREAQKRWRENHPEEAKKADNRKRDRKDYYKWRYHKNREQLLDEARQRRESMTDEEKEAKNRQYTESIKSDPERSAKYREQHEARYWANREKRIEQAKQYRLDHKDELLAKERTKAAARRAALAKDPDERTEEEQKLVEQVMRRRERARERARQIREGTYDPDARKREIDLKVERAQRLLGGITIEKSNEKFNRLRSYYMEEGKKEKALMTAEQTAEYAAKRRARFLELSKQSKARKKAESSESGDDDEDVEI